MFSFLHPTLGSSLRARCFTFFIGTLFVASPLFAHTVTVFWCIDPSGANMRVWHEHWHGDQTTITSTLDLTIVINGGTPIFLPATPPTGAINNTPQANLPCDYGPCGVGQQILATTSRTSTYNDWAYWDVDLQAAGLCDDDNPVVTAQVTASNPSSAIFFNFQGTVPATANSNITLPDCTPFMVECDSPPEDPVFLGCLNDIAAFNSLSLTPPAPNDPDADFGFSFSDSAPSTVGCITTIDRTYTWRVRRTDPCTMEETIESGTCVSRYTMTFNTGGPNIDSVQAFTDYGCAGDLRSVAESQSNVVSSDPDNNIVSLILDSESRVTNDCQVTVTRIWEVEDCCNFKDQATETYVFDLTPGDIGNTTLDILRVGCISSTALIPAPVATDAGDVPACEPLAIAFDSERPFGGILGPCEEGIERVYRVTTRCSSGTIVQPVIYTTETGAPTLSVAPFENYACAGDVRSLADSQAALVASDPDGAATIVTTNLVSELRSTNDCDVTVTRNWAVIDCCGNQATAVETYAYTMGVGDLMFELDSVIDLGCIGSEAEIDPLVIIPLTDNDFCDGIEITLFSDDEFPQEGCVLNRERIYQVSVGCSETLVTQLFQYVIAEDPGIKITGLPNPQDFGCLDPEDDCFEIPCLFDEVTTSVPIPNVVVPLVNGTTTAPLDFGCTTNGTTYPPDLNNLINDPFPYNPGAAPNSSKPGLTYDGYGGGVVCPRDGVAFNAGGGAINFGFKKTPVQFVDLWGRVDCPCDRDVLDPRDNGFVIRLYDSCGELAHESGPQTIPDDPADAFLRYMFPAGITATGIEIDGTGIDFFTLQEMRLVSTGICAEDVVTTNECDVTVLRTYTVQGCCSSDSRTVPFTYHLTPELSVTEVDDLELGCISDVDQIPPFDLTMCVAETTCGDLEIKFKDVSAAVVNGCLTTIERSYSIEADCGVTQCITQVVSYVLNAAPPMITAVAPYENFGCDGDRRPVADSESALVISDPDGAGTYNPNLASEVRTTNDCKVTVQRLWEVRDCCGLRDSAIETYEYQLTDQDIMGDRLANLDLGCIASTDLIPPPDFVEAGTMASCGELKITFVSQSPLANLPPCYQGIRRVYDVEMPCTTSRVTQDVRYILDDEDPEITAVLPFQDYGCVAAEPRPQAASLAGLGSSDDTLVLTTELLDEVRLTNDCVVTVTRTWQVEDCCGKTSQRDETYQYTMQPDAVALAPLDALDLACIDSLDDIPEPNTTILDATSDCSVSNTEHVSDRAVGSTLGACYSAIDRTYRVTDLCGGTATVVQRIDYILDTENPSLTVPDFQDFGCVAADPRPADTNAVLGTDDLLVLETNLLTEAYLTNDCVVSVTRTWQVVDCCGKTAQLDETYQYTVTPGPLTVTALAPLDLRCIDALDDIPEPNTTIVDAMSDCAVASIAFVSDVAVASDQGGCYEAIDRTYQVTDLCGSTASVVQRIDYIIDLVPPTIDSVPAFQDYGCVATDPQPLDITVIVGSDADGHLVSTTLVSEVRIENDCVFTVTRNWRVEDCCGKFDLAQEIYQYTVTPDAPTIASIDDLDLRCIDSIDDLPEPNPSQVRPSSACTISTIEWVSDAPVASTLGQCYSAIERTYQVTDKCGATVTAVQRIDYILDTSPPEILEVAAFEDFSCVPADPRSQADSLAALVLSDDLLIVETNLLDEVYLTNDCAITVVRTWQVIDCCDRTETRNETYTYVLQPGPLTVEALAPINLECIDAIGDIPLPNTTIVDAMSDCLVSNIEFVSDVAVASDLGGCYSAIDRTYEATDRCGGTASVVQRIDYILDAEDPTLVVPAFVDYGCVDTDPRPADTNAIVTADDLLVLETNLLQEVRLTNDCVVTVTRTWQVVDCCGNTATLDETYRYTERPSELTVTALAPVDLNCIDALGDIPQPNTTIVAAMSDCLVDGIIWTDDLPVLEAEECSDAIDRVYEITDKCGGTASVTQRITYLLDVSDPVISEVAPFVDYGCVSEDPRSVEMSSNAVVSSDDHLVVATNLLSEVYLTNDCDITVTRLWEVTDCCGNTGNREETYRYTLQSSEPPTIPTIANFDLRCIDTIGDIPAPDTSLVNALSECPIATVAHVSDTPVASELGTCYSAIDRVYSATDNCGAVATITQRIDYLLDSGDPLITAVAAFEDYGCVTAEPRPLADSMAAIETSDDSLVLATNLVNEVRLTNDCVVIVTRTWQIWDCCSNENTRVETYQFTEQAASPTITGVNLIELGCISSTNQIPLPSASQFTVSSDCDTQVTMISELVDLPTDPCIASITRTYRVTDNCGQSADISQTFSYILNSRDPLITAVPAGINYGCVADSFDFAGATPPLTNDVVVADDNLVSTIWLGDTFTTNGCDVTVIRLWEVTDCCGATDRATAIYEYRLQGNGPMLTCPDNLELGCIPDLDQIPEPASITVGASSECGTVIIEHVGDSPPVTVDACRQSVQRTYRIIDECGLQRFCLQTITFTLDNASPSLMVSNFVDYGCVDDEPRPVLVSSNALVTSDDSSVVATQLVSEVRLTNDCVVTVTRTWEVTDCCNNTTEREETYRFTLRPSAVTVAELAPVDLNCIDSLGDIPLPNTTLIAAQSDCSIADIIWLRDDTGPSTYCTDSLDRVYRITDLCGGTAVVTQRFTWILDVAPPTIDVVPPFVDYGCQDSDPRPADTNTVIGSDADNHLVSTTLVAQVTVTNDCRVTVTRTWRVEDCCNKFDLANESYAYTLRPSTVTTAALAPIDLGCLDDEGQIPEPNTTLVDAMSDCSVVAIEFVSNSVPVKLGCVTTMERTYRATDLCGGTTTVTQDLSWVLNTLDPFIITAGVGTNYGCQTPNWVIPPANAADTNAVQYTDDNVTNVTWLGDAYATNDCLVTVVRTWEIIDCCDNRDRGTVEYTYTVIPERPTITCQPTYQLDCITSVDQLPNVDDTAPEVTSSCGGYTVEMYLERFLPSRDCLDQVQRFYRVTDVCGAERTCNVRILYILDTAPPEITAVPPFVDNGCAGDPRPVPLVNEVIATDDRHITTVFLKQEIRTTNECQVTVQRIWRAEDCCGKFDERTEIYQFTNDPSDPELAALNALNLGCIDALNDIPEPNTTLPAIAAACAAADIIWVEDQIVGALDKCTEAIDRIYLATDLCNGTGSVTQRISYILDASPPTIVSVPPFIDAGCVADPRPVPLTNEVIATDIETHLVSTQLVAELRLTNDCKITVQRTWRVEDCCGKFDVAIETYSYTAIPNAITVEALAPVALGCLNDIGQIPLPNTTLVAASSACAIASIEWLADTPTGSGTCVSTLDRTYQATDLCGGTAVVTQQISWVLNIMDPIITDAGIEVNFGCQAPGFLVPPTSPSQTNEVVLMDDNVTNVTWISDSYTTNDCNVTVLRTWQVIDCCGNKDRADVTYLFNIIPPTPDVATLCPDDIDLECITSLGAIPTPVATLGTVAGGCNIEVSHLGDSPAVKSSDNCAWSFVRTNLVTDTCGVSTTCAFTIRYKLDAVPPVLAGIPPQLHYGCLSGDPRDVASVSNAIMAASSDPDDNAFTVNLNNTTVLTNDCEITISRQWRVTDCCGRVDFGTEVYQYTDAPVDLTADALAPIELGCINNAGQVPQPNPALVDADSLCSIESVEWASDTPADQSGCDWTVTRTYEVTDLCGMVIPVLQTITYTLDQNDPVIVSAPEDIDFGCVSTNPVPVADPALDLVVTDDSLVVSRSFSDVLTSNECAYVLVRTWTIVDCCGRTDDTTTTYTWITRPDMPEVGPLSDRNLGCITSVDQVPQQDTSIVEANSDCSVAQIAWIADSTGSTDRCTDYLDRVYQVTDLCGASAVVTQRFTWILNTMDPMITVVPPGTDFGCVAVGFEIPAPNTNALVAMDDNLVSTQWIGDVTTTSPNGDCITTVVRTWQVVDCCGTKAEASATFTFVETPAAPDVATLCPPDIELGCIASPGLIPNTLFTLGQATADCDVSTTHLGDGPAITNGCTISFVRTNLATTVCGVSQSCSFRISYTLDNAAPRIVSVPDHVDYGCVELDPNPVPRTNDVVTSDDNQTVTTYLLSEVRTTDECVVTVTRTWRTEDCCDRSDVAISTYTYIETPDLVAAAPADLLLGCIQSAAQLPTPAPSSVAADSACPILVEHIADTIVTALGDCLTEIDRTYRVSDSCSSLVVTQRISYSLDDKAPKFLLPLPGGDLGCQPADAPTVPTLADDLAALTVTDNCEVVVMQFSETHTTNGCDVTLVRSYMAMDACNNAEVVNVIYRWTERPSAPSIAALLPTDLGCIGSVANVPPAVPGLLQISNACGVTSVDWTGDTSPVRNACTWEIIRSFEVTDLCGGTDAIEQRITFTLDSLDPSILSAPETEHFECVAADPYPVPRTNLVVSSDDSLIVSTELIREDRISASGSCDTTVLRLWEVTDCCGNIARTQSEYSYRISPASSLACPADLTVPAEPGCQFQIPDLRSQLSTATSCGDVNTLQFPTPGTLVYGTGSYPVEFIVSDTCGVSTSCSMNVNVTGTCVPDGVAAIELDKTIIDSTAPGACGSAVEAVIIDPGSAVTWCFTICNTGNLTLNNVALTDGDLLGGISIPLGTLPVGGCTNVSIVANMYVDQLNVAQATGDPIDGSPTVRDEDPARVRIRDIGEGFTFDKSISLDGSCPGSEFAEPAAGDLVTFCYDIINSTPFALTNAFLTDSFLGLSLPLGVVQPGENIITSATWTATGETLVNTATIIGQPVDENGDPAGPQVGDTNTATSALGYIFDKSASLDGTCPGQQNVEPEPGDLVTFCFFGTNTGELAIADVTVSDPILGYLINLGTIAPGEGFLVSTNWTYTGGTFVNAASSTGQPVDENGNPTGEVYVVTNSSSAGPAYFFDKTISNTGNCPGFQAIPVDLGDDVTFCFTLQNLTSDPLTDITVSDAALGFSHSIDALAGFDTWGTSIVFTITEEPFVNSGLLDLTDPNGNTNSVTNTATAGDALQFAKTASLDGTCPGFQHVEPVAGDTVTFCFMATNISDATIQNVTISDPTIGFFANVGNLGPNEGVLLSTNSVYTGGTFVNAASVTGTPDDGGPPIATTNTASAGPAYFFDKTVSTDGNCPGYQFTPAELGDDVTFCFTLQNLTDKPLTDITVADPAIGLNHMIASLPGFASWSTSVVSTVTEKPFVNTASLDLTDPNGNPVGETNTATIADAFMFNKTVSLDGTCPGFANVEPTAGDTVTFCLFVQNLTATPIHDLTITDPAIGATYILGTLAALDSISLSTNMLFTGGTFVNAATATGTPEGGPPISTTNTASAGPAYFFDKTISPNGNCPGVQIYPAEDDDYVTFCFTLQNLTADPLTDISVTDPALGLNYSVAALPGFATWQTSIVMQIEQAPFVNLAVVDLTDPNGNPQTDTNAATAGDALFFDKTISLDGSCPGEQSATPAAGDEVTFCFYIENTSGFPLTNLELQDPALGINVAIGTLLPGESFNTSTTWTATGAAFVNRASVTGDGPDGPIEFIDEATSTAFDCCVTDTDPPTIIEAPKDTDLGCVGPLPEPDTSLILATDACGEPIVKLLMAMTNVNGCTTMAMHRYRVSDVCGNFQDIDIEWMLTNDTTPPTFTCPEALEIPLPDTCIAIVPQITPQTFNEECGGLVFTQTPAAGSTLEGPGTYEILITASDACGNQSSCMTSIKVSGICDSDLEPAISLEKTIIAGHNNGANCADAVESITVTPGTPVTWCFRVINNGEIMLQNVTITDTDLEPDLQFVAAAALPPNQSASHFVQGLASESLENQAGVNGRPTNGKPDVIDSDTASLVVVSPAIDLVKTVSLDGNCPGEKYVEGPQSTPITYCFDVTNTGDVTLNNVVLDDQPLNVFATLGSLSPGQSVSYQQAGIIPGLLTNVAIATGSPAGGLPDISDRDEAVVSTGLASLSGIVWTDLSNDGDPNNENLDELGLSNATVYLFDPNGNLVATTSTDNNGAYGFAELLAGEYTVEVDPNSIDPSLVNQSTPGAYLTDLPIGMSQVDFDFGFLPGATYVELEFFIGTVTEDGVQLDWRFGFEQDSLGYNIFRDGKKVNEQLMLAGSTSTFLDVGARGGNYVLQVIDSHLDTEEFGPVLPILAAGPIAGPTRNIQAIDNEAVFNTSTNWLNYFIYGFDHPPSATDNTNRRQLKGEGVSIDGESGIYLHAEPEIEVEVK